MFPDLLRNFLQILPELAVMPTGHEFLMKQGVHQLIEWPISCSPTYHRDFLHRIQALCLPHGGTKIIPSTIPPLLNGMLVLPTG